jgi:hypothetical protein
VGLLSAPLSLVREPLRLTFRLWELGFSAAAEVARIGTDLLDPDRAEHPDFARRSPAAPPAPSGNGAPPDPDGPLRETPVARVDVPPPAPEPRVEAPPPAPEPRVDAPPAVPDTLVPNHVDEEIELVAEAAEEGAEDGAGAELHVDPPWDGYDQMTAGDIRDRLSAATRAEAAAVELYEATGKSRRTVLDAAERALRR